MFRFDIRGEQKAWIIKWCRRNCRGVYKVTSNAVRFGHMEDMGAFSDLVGQNPTALEIFR